MTAQNPQVYRAFTQVTHLCAPPVILFQPRVVRPASRAALGHEPAAAPPKRLVLPSVAARTP